MFQVGIYKIECLPTGMVYIGSTNDFESRKKQHFKDLEQKRHVNNRLQTDYLKYGKNNFVFLIIEYTWRSNRLEKEQKWIDKYRKENKCYNEANSNNKTKSQTSKIKKIWNALINSIKENIL